MVVSILNRTQDLNCFCPFQLLQLTSLNCTKLVIVTLGLLGCSLQSGRRLKVFSRQIHTGDLHSGVDLQNESTNDWAARSWQENTAIY